MRSVNNSIRLLNHNSFLFFFFFFKFEVDDMLKRLGVNLLF